MFLKGRYKMWTHVYKVFHGRYFPWKLRHGYFPWKLRQIFFPDLGTRQIRVDATIINIIIPKILEGGVK